MIDSRHLMFTYMPQDITMIHTLHHPATPARSLLSPLSLMVALSVALFTLSAHADDAKKPKAAAKEASKTKAVELIPVKSRAVAPDFELDDLEEEPVVLSELKGKVVVVNFWATWCEPCKQEIPHLDKILKQYKKQGLEVLTISTDNAQTQARVERYARGWSTRTMIDADGEVKSMLNPRGFAPYTLIVDRAGLIAFMHQGYNAGDEVKLEAVIKALLTEKR